MASANIIFGGVGGTLSIFDHGFTSQNVASGAQSALTTATHGACRVTPIGAAMYAAFGTNPSAAADPRVYIPAGQSFDVRLGSGMRVAVLDA